MSSNSSEGEFAHTKNAHTYVGEIDPRYKFVSAKEELFLLPSSLRGIQMQQTKFDISDVYLLPHSLTLSHTHTHTHTHTSLSLSFADIDSHLRPVKQIIRVESFSFNKKTLEDTKCTITFQTFDTNYKRNDRHSRSMLEVNC